MLLIKFSKFNIQVAKIPELKRSNAIRFKMCVYTHKHTDIYLHDQRYEDPSYIHVFWSTEFGLMILWKTNADQILLSNLDKFEKESRLPLIITY